MEFQGLESGFPRRPLLPMKPNDRDDLAQIFRKMNTEFAEIS
jgi:hypothetical protein